MHKTNLQTSLLAVYFILISSSSGCHFFYRYLEPGASDANSLIADGAFTDAGAFTDGATLIDAKAATPDGAPCGSTICALGQQCSAGQCICTPAATCNGICDNNGNCHALGDPAYCPSNEGCVATIANDATFTNLRGIALDRATQRIYVVDTGAHVVRKLYLEQYKWKSSILAGVAGQSGTSDNLGTFSYPIGLAHHEGSLKLYVTDHLQYGVALDAQYMTIREISWETGTVKVKTVAGVLSGTGCTPPASSCLPAQMRFHNSYELALNADGSRLLLAESTNKNIWSFTASNWNTPATKIDLTVTYNVPSAAFHPLDTNVVYALDDNGAPVYHTYFLKNGSTDVLAEFDSDVVDSVIDSSGTYIYFVSVGMNCIYRRGLSAPSVPDKIFGLPSKTGGHVDGPASSLVQFNMPRNIALDESNKRLYVTDTGSSKIRVVFLPE